MKFKRVMTSLCTSFCLLLLPLMVSANGVEQMNRFVTELTQLQAGFEQTVLAPDQQQAARSQGIFYLQRPGRFRWDYFEPEGQQIIADGESIWLIDPDLEQVSVQDQDDALAGTPALFLVGGDAVEKHFEVIDIGASQGFDWVELIPRDPDSQFVRVLLAFSDDLLQRMEMTDGFGQVTRFQFYDIQHNPTFKPGLFIYERPLNFDLYNG